MPAEIFLIHKLAQRAGTTVRTIRYYTEEGLLPPPLIQGKYAYYTLDHLNRLELIRRMKDAYLPLREIRDVLSTLTDEEVRQRLSESSPPPPNSLRAPSQQPASEPPSDALEYITRLMDEQALHQTKGRNPSLQPPAPSNAPPERLPVSSFQRQDPQGEVWQRIPLAPGVELHLRSPEDPELASRIFQLITFARKIFVRSK